MESELLKLSFYKTISSLKAFMKKHNLKVATINECEYRNFITFLSITVIEKWLLIKHL